jgi:glucose-1-phosphate thymidylyltransferase
MEEKPAEPKSSYALTGLYFFDSEIAKFVEALSPSPRGELEILDLLKSYRQLGALKVSILPRGTAWLDTGTFESLHDAGTFIKIIEERTGLAVGDPIDVAKNQGWIK